MKSRRRTIHAELLAALERGVVPARAEELGHHAAAAEIWAKALHHYGAAGKAALDRAANAEGLALSVKALDAGGRLTGDITAEVAMIDLHRARSWAHLTVGDTLRMLAELREAETRAARFGMARLTCQLKAQRTHVESIFGGHTRRAVRYGREAARIARALGDADLASAAQFVTGYALLFAGDARAAVAELAVDADAYQRGLRIIAAGSSGTLAVDGLATLGHALGQLGRWDEALARGAEARAVAAETGSPWDMNVANYHLARTLLTKGDVAAALPLIEWNLELLERTGLRMALPWFHKLLGQARLLAGRHGEAIELLDRAVAGCAELRLEWTRTSALLAKAEACLAADQAGALAAATSAVELARAHGYRGLEAAGLRLLATACPANDRASALEHLANARTIAATLDLPPELDLIAAQQARLDGNCQSL